MRRSILTPSLVPILLLALGAGPARAACGDGALDLGEACDPGPDVPDDCCTASCSLELAGTTCRPEVGFCDVAESCSGVGAACPADGGLSDGAVCNIIPGTCQGGDCQAPMAVTRLRMRGGTDPTFTGTVHARANFQTQPPEDIFTITTNVTVRVQDSLSVDRTYVWDVAECRITRGFRCLSGGLKARFTPSRLNPTDWNLNLRLKGADIYEPFSPPVTITVSNDSGTDRAGSINDCAINGAGSLNCQAY
jgi:cysteine-rich repeat protein